MLGQQGGREGGRERASTHRGSAGNGHFFVTIMCQLQHVCAPPFQPVGVQAIGHLCARTCFRECIDACLYLSMCPCMRTCAHVGVHWH